MVFLSASVVVGEEESSDIGREGGGGLRKGTCQKICREVGLLRHFVEMY